MTLPDFPEARGAVLALPSPGVTLRAADEADLPFLQELHAEQRIAELGALALPAAAMEAFCAMQFRMQHVQYIAGFPYADFWIVEQAGTPVGRLYLDRSSPSWRVIEIVLADAVRGRGIGGTLIHAVQQAAREACTEEVTLHVLRDNLRAQAFYNRLGFEEGETKDGIQAAMTWTP